MKKIFNISAIISVCLVAAGLSACSKQPIDTNQYPSNEVKLASYGPNPVMRGGTLRFFGSNLQDIVEVSVPGISAITDIEVVTSGSPSEIRVQLPADGETTGTVTIKTADGKTFTTKSALSYVEPIVFDSFSPAEAMPGDVITVKGDYMNLVQSITFADEVKVSEVEHIDRYTAKVTVPSKAITGKIILSDEGEIANLLYSDEELKIGDPTVGKLTVKTAKPAEEAVISGSYLDMIKEVEFSDKVTVSDFTLAEDHKSITVAIPAEAKSGDVTAVSYAGKPFVAGKIAMIQPTALKVSPAPVKAGAELTITGKDLDIVKTIDLPGASAVSFKASDGKLVLTVPATATEGDLILTMANGDAVTAAYTLVHPTVTSVSPAAIKAGESITVKGTNLDLVTEATLGGKAVTFTVTDEGLVLTTEKTSVSGKIVLKLANAETIEPAQTVTVTYDSFVVVNEMPGSEHIGATVTLKGSNFMMIENIFIGTAKVAQYISRTDTEISFIMPYNPIGTYSVYFHLLSGDVETCPQQLGVLLEIKHIIGWEGNLSLTWGDGGRAYIPAVTFAGVKAGSKMRIYYSQIDKQWGAIQFNYGDWSGIDFNGEGGTKFNQQLTPTDIYGWFTDGILDRCNEVVLTKEILDKIQAKKAGPDKAEAGSGMIMMGQSIILKKVEILQEIPQETTIWEGSSYSGDNYDNNLELGAETDWIKAGLEVGDEIRVYFTTTSTSDWQIQLFSGHWDGLAFDGHDPANQFNATNAPDAVSNGYIAFEVNASHFSALTSIKNWGSAIIVQGKLCTITKIAFK